jgi:hypothetical protein
MLVCDNCKKPLKNVWISVATDGNGQATFGDLAESGLTRFADEATGEKVFGSVECLVAFATWTEES